MRLHEKQLGYSVDMTYMNMSKVPEYEMRRRAMDELKHALNRGYPECSKCEHIRMDEQMEHMMEHMMDRKSFRLGCKLGPRPVCPDVVAKMREDMMRLSIYPSTDTSASTTVTFPTNFSGKGIDRAWIDEAVMSPSDIRRQQLAEDSIRKSADENLDLMLHSTTVKTVPRRKDSPRTEAADAW